MCFEGVPIQNQGMSDLTKPSSHNALIDPFGRTISYLRLSVTDRCDLRCAYCMPERMQFLPKRDVLSFEELERMVALFVRRGVKKLRLTGGEPLVRKDIGALIERLGAFVADRSLSELTLTTNGVRLADFAEALAAAGVKRVNVSLDSLDPATFHRITRREKIQSVIKGLDAAQAAGLRVKINTVALKHDNAEEIPSIIEWAHDRDMDVSLIEVMPMGDVDGDRIDQYLPLTFVRDALERQWTLERDDYRTGGPSRYYRVVQTGGRVGFISPLTNNFCDGCNRVRMTCTGKLYMCLGQNDQTDFRALLRAGASDADLDAALVEAITRKPYGHDFEIRRRNAAPAVDRAMSVTGG